MSYLLIKSLHICAIILWIAGMVLQAATLQFSVERRLLESLRRWDRRVTAPAMLVAWITGLFLANLGDWFGNGWLMIKLTFVICLAALHGLLAGRLRRRLESGVANNPPLLSVTLAGLFGLTASIVVLVVVKPF
ncbi:CopD family protein [Steroidobacter flavus]|uniref:Protoporphyrinogen IX oxidase n=1 Tax=Steroidobacter flavus TaxID=1842136 RepID=A0ABV8T5H6_9GAMM